MLGYLFDAEFKGTYVDIGAFHPMLLSNTYELYRKGWRGIAVDANPDAAPLFARFRPEDTFIHSAVGQGSGTVEMATFAESVFNCTSDQLKEVPERLRSTARMITVPIAPLASILASGHISGVDFLSVDCEGNDLNVLKSNDWSRWSPKVVCVEDHAEDWVDSEIVSYLRAFDYVLKYRAVYSSIFVLAKLVRKSSGEARLWLPLAHGE